MRGKRLEQRGGKQAVDDGLDRSDAWTLASLNDQWLEWLEQRNYSPRTIEGRQRVLRLFTRWAEDRDLRRPADITKPILESFQRYLWRHRKSDGRPLSVGTQRDYLIILQHLFAWLCKSNFLHANPASDLELPRETPRSLPKAFSFEEIQKIFAVPNTSDPLGLRDRAILETLYATGLRRRELVNLDVEDLDRSRNLLTVRKGKGGKDRVVPTGTRALSWLERYLEQVRPRLEMSINERALFITGYGNRLSPDFVGNWVKRTMQQAGVERTGSCHLFRHSCATHMLEGGADVRYIQQLLGHSELNSTAIYTQVSVTQLQTVHAMSHPSARQPKEER